MSDQPSSYGLPVLESYSVELAPSPPLESREAALAVAQPRLQITLSGRNFVERAMIPIIMIGKIQVKEYRIMPDERTIVCYLDELPEEGATISIGYGGSQRAELPERFSRSKIPGGAPPTEIG